MSNTDSWLEIPKEETNKILQSISQDLNPMSCRVKVHLMFFFDGMGFNKDGSIKKSGYISNVNALSKSAVRDTIGCILPKSIYISGMMTPLEVGQAVDTMIEQDLKNYAKEQAKDKATDTAKDLGKDVKKNAEDLLESANEKLKKNIPIDRVKKDLLREIKDAGKIVYSDLKASIQDAFKSPLKLGKKIIKGLVPDAVNGVVSYIPIVRDAQILARLLNRGASERINKAIAQFIEELEAIQNPITEIHVSVFGSDFGAGLARGFLNALVDECDGKRTDSSLKYKLPDNREVPLKVKFVGLFDSLGNRWSSADALINEKLVSYIPIVSSFITTKNQVAENIELPACVEKVVHFISANECVTRVHTVNNATLMPIDANPVSCPQRVEMIYPGVGWDISGGFGVDSYGIGNFMGDVTLQEMWRHARLSGVPLRPLKSLRTTIPKLADRFDMQYTAHLRRVLRAFNNDLNLNKDHLFSMARAREALIETGGKSEWQKSLFLHRFTYLTWLQYAQDLIRNTEGSHRMTQFEYINSQVYMLNWAKNEFVKRSKTHIGFEYITRLSYYEKCAFMHLFRYNEMKLTDSIKEIFLDYCHPAFVGEEDSTPNGEFIYGAHLYPLLPRFIDEGKEPENDKSWWDELKGYKKDIEEYLEIGKSTVTKDKKLTVPFQ